MDNIISVEELSHHLDDEGWRVFDCRFELANPNAGGELYAVSHIPGALHADLERDLSGRIIPGTTGRHPLPDREEWLERVCTWGIHNDTRIVAYDGAGGAWAARLWWLMRWIGHEGVAVLDGGFSRWKTAGLPITDAPYRVGAPGTFQARGALTRAIECDEIVSGIADGRLLLIDARDGARFRGEVEPIDPVAGHIPGAHSLPYADNLDANGLFRSREELAARYLPLLVRDEEKEVVCYCGSGVTAVHNVLAMVHAGLDEPMLYAGSWSEWIIDPQRPIESG